MSKLAKAITMAFARTSFNLACAVHFITRMFVPRGNSTRWKLDTVQTLDAIAVLGAEQKPHPKLQDLTLTSRHYGSVSYGVPFVSKFKNDRRLSKKSMFGSQSMFELVIDV